MKTSLSIFIAALAAGSATAADFHVAPDGKDTNPGTAKKPLATLEKARDVVRGYKAAHPGEANAILLHGGEYRLGKPVIFAPEDSGLPGKPLIITAAPGEQPVLTSATPITGWKLVDAAGNLVGVNTAIYSRTGGSLGIGFAIPVSTAKQVMEQIIATGSVTRGWIGVEAQEISPELAESFRLPSTSGALIAGVLKGSPADRAGVKPGDILISINTVPVTDPTAMLNIVANLIPGKAAALKLRRDQKDIDLQVEAGKRPPATRRR